MKTVFFQLVFGFLCLHAFAQKRVTISGYINDAATGETMIGATLNVKGQAKGISSNQYGIWGR